MIERNRVRRQGLALLMCGVAALLVLSGADREQPRHPGGFAPASSLSLDVRLDLGVITAALRLSI